jgi:OsmC-like protein.
MKPLPHVYGVTLSSTPTGYATLLTGGVPASCHLSSGTVDRKDGSTRFTDIVLRLRLTLPKGADPERAKRMLEKGKNACLVTASLAVPVRLESEIVVDSPEY